MIPQLRTYQRDGADWLASRRTGLLADVMGLGKTAQAVTACLRVCADKGDRALVVCPASVVGVWRDEFRKWAGYLPLNVTVASYDMLVRRPQDFAGIWRVLILDEAHYLKNPKAKRTKAIFGKDGIARHAYRIWCLTGTPAPNNPSELWPMLHALAPETIAHGRHNRPMNHFEFENRYCVVKSNGFGRVIVRGQRQDELKKRIAPFVLRRTKREVAQDLPPIAFGDLAFDSTDAVRELRLAATGYEETNIAAALEIGGVAGLQTIAQEMATLRRLTAMAKAPLLAAWVKDWFNGVEDGEKLVIFGVHRDPLETLARELSRFSPSLLHGGTPQKQRPEQVARFQEDPKARVFIGQVHAAGTGLTLTAASTLVFLEQSWTPSDNLQAAMRIHRIGQRSNCMVHAAMLAGSIDESVSRVLARKTEDLVRLGLLEMSD